jgi:hypothetical protein
MSTLVTLWPEPDELLSWFGEANLSRNERSEVVAVSAEAIQKAYDQWHETHREASEKIAELQEVSTDKVDGPLKAKIKRLERELRAARGDANEIATLESQLLQAGKEAATWKQRCDQLFTMNERNSKILDMYEELKAKGTSGDTGAQNLIVQKIKPHEPKRFDGAQDLEVVAQFLEDVQHYVRQGGAVCQKASGDNQKIDTLWRFLTTKTFRWFEDTMKKEGVDTIPPKDFDYKITWEAVKVLFKRQYVPERAISVIRREWYALRFTRQQVLSFNQRALELITILGGSLTITRENPLWEEYLIKLPEATQNDIAQQARLMDILGNGSQMTLSGMMDIVAARTLPFLPTLPSSSTPQPRPLGNAMDGDPMDLTNVENDELNAVVDNKVQCHQCSGFGHIARQCGTPSTTNRGGQVKPRGEQEGGRRGAGRDGGRDVGREGGRGGGREGGPQNKRYESRQPLYQQPYRSNQPNWRTSAKRVNVVDDPEMKSGAYFDGAWAEEGTVDDSGGLSDLADMGGQSEGKDGQ